MEAGFRLRRGKPARVGDPGSGIRILASGGAGVRYNHRSEGAMMWTRLTLAVVVLATASVVFADVEISIDNAGFERLDPNGAVSRWGVDTKTLERGVSVSGTTDLFHGGVGSLVVTHEEPASTAVFSEPVQLQVGHLYRLSGWIRTAAVYSDPTAKYPTAMPACLTMTTFPFTNHSPTIGADTDWTRVERLFIATSSEDRVGLHLGYNGTASGTAWFDDIRLEEVEDIAEYIPFETVRWFGDGYRYDDKGWIFVHIEGEPYQRGYQYGYLLADEIAAYMDKLAVVQNEGDPAAGWKDLRFEADTLFLRDYDLEYLTEMRGIADGAVHAGAVFGDRPLDLLDIVTINSVIDIGQLHDAIEVTPTALTGESFMEIEREMQISESSHKCSAFVATGPATADGDVVFGQIFMWRGYTGVHWNVITDVEPSEGHRLVYQTFPGGIHSGADFYINSAGIVIGETTVAQTPFEPDSTPQSNRIRKAAQYAESIDDVERILWDGNNGMYTNDWPIADMKTGEVAILLLGTHTKKLWRTSEDMSPFGTPGFLWANNNNRDPEVRKEYLAQPDDRPYDLVFTPWNRDVAFNEFYREYVGRIDATAAVNLWASSPVNRAHACDGKITTTQMARELVFLAHYGKVTLREKFPQPGYRIMPDLPNAVPHLSLGYSVPSPIYITDELKKARDAGRFAHLTKSFDEHKLVVDEPGDAFSSDPARLWRGTVFPASDAENWFVSASAAYWRILEGLGEDDPVGAAKGLAEELGGLNARFLYTLSREPDLAAVQTQRAYDVFGPYQIPRIKGTFALHQLRLQLGNDSFFDLMNTVHQRFANREMSNADFLAVAGEIAGRDLSAEITPWIERTGVPGLRPEVKLSNRKSQWQVEVVVHQDGDPYRLVTHVAITTDGERHLYPMDIEGRTSRAVFTIGVRPTLVEFNAVNDILVDNSNFYTWRNFFDDFHHTLIVYGTGRQDEANHTLARRWQETLANAYVEILPPLVKDSELTAEQAASSDLIVIGSLDDNNLLFRLGVEEDVTWGKNHFVWQGTTYAGPDQGLFLVMPNPLNPERAVYLVVANSALQLYEMTKNYTRGIPSWALFEGDEVTAKGYHAPDGFRFEFPGE